MHNGPLFVINCSSLSPLSLSCYGCRTTHTPAFDQLAASGIVFHEHYQSSNHTPDINLRESLKKSVQQTAELTVSCETQDSWKTELANLDLTQLELIWVQIQTSSDSDSTPVDTETVRQWIDEICRELLEKQEPISGLLTASTGRLHDIDEPELAPFAGAVSRSVTIANWLPLIFFGGLANRSQQTGHITQLTDNASLVTALQTGIASRDNTDDNADVEVSPVEQVVLKTADSVGLRTAGDLLVVPYDVNFEETDEVPVEAAYFIKPDDRFDVNDVITTAPGTVLERWQTLCALQQTETSA